MKAALRFAVRASAHVRALMTQNSCTVGMSNAKLRNHLNLDIEYQNSDLWSLRRRGANPCTPPLVTGLQRFTEGVWRAIKVKDITLGVDAFCSLNRAFKSSILED